MPAHRHKSPGCPCLLLGPLDHDGRLDIVSDIADTLERLEETGGFGGTFLLDMESEEGEEEEEEDSEQESAASAPW